MKLPKYKLKVSTIVSHMIYAMIVFKLEKDTKLRVKASVEEIFIFHHPEDEPLIQIGKKFNKAIKALKTKYNIK